MTLKSNLPPAFSSGLETLEGRTLLSGSGITGAYFANPDLTGAKFARVDSAINFNWTTTHTPASSLGTDGFSVRWYGSIVAKTTGAYKLLASSSGGVRVYVNNVLVIDDWSTHNLKQDRSANINLTAGKKINLRVEYTSNGKTPLVQLLWQSSQQSQQIIPKSQLYAAAIDKTSPTRPTTLRATHSGTTASLTWHAASDASGVVGYDVYVNGVRSGTTTRTSFSRTGLLAGHTYTFSVRAIDPSGNVSPAVSTALVASAPANRAPTAPTNLQAIATSTSSIALSWTKSTDDHGVAGYRIYRNDVKIAATTGTTFTDTGLSAGTSLTYRVRAVDTSGVFSTFSSSATRSVAIAGGSHNAFSSITASDFDASSGVSKSGSDVTNTDDRDYITFENTNFGSGAKSVFLNLSLPSSNRGGSIELHLDSVGGKTIGGIAVQPTGSFSTFRNQQINIITTTGTHDLYIVFRGRSGVGNLRGVQFSTDHLTTVMALGDSITQQSTWANSYRYYLWHDLQDAGKTDVDFVGSQTQAWVEGGGLADPANFNFDQDNEGHANYRADQIADNVNAWATANVPDIVLLHVGINDLRQGQSADSTASDIARIIDNLRSVNSNVKILLAKIIPADGYESAVDQLNDLIGNLAASNSTSASPITIVDMNSGFTDADHYTDGIHTNNTGDQFMADRWFAALAPLLS